MLKIALVASFIGGEIVSLIQESGLVAKVVLLILLLFSVISWAIILSKWASLSSSSPARWSRYLRTASRNFAADKASLPSSAPPKSLPLRNFRGLNDACLGWLQQAPLRPSSAYSERCGALSTHFTDLELPAPPHSGPWRRESQRR